MPRNTKRSIQEKKYLVLCKRFLRSEPEPTIDQLAQLSLSGVTDVVKDLGFESLLASLQQRPLDLLKTQHGSALLTLKMDRLWPLYRGLAKGKISKSDFDELISHSDRHPEIALDIESEYRKKFQCLSERALRALAEIHEDRRVALWRELIELDLVGPSVAKQFIRYPETAIQAGTWMLWYRYRYPNGRGPYSRKDFPSAIVMEPPITPRDLAVVLEIPSLRAKTVKSILSRKESSLIDARDVVDAVMCHKGRYGSGTGMKSLIRLLFKNAQVKPHAYLCLLRLPLSTRARKRVEHALLNGLEAWLKEDVLYYGDLRSVLSRIEPDVRRRLRMIMNQYAASRRKANQKTSQKDETQVLFEKLMGRFYT